MNAYAIQGRRGRPIPPPPLTSFAIVYETPGGLAFVPSVEARDQGEALERAFRLNAIDEDLVLNARVFAQVDLFRTVDDVLAEREVRS